jgi:hypothetical protein
MLNILWVEDEYSEQKQKEWFKDRIVTVKNSFDDAEQAIQSDLHDYDVVVLDINLENSEHSLNVEKYAKQFSKGDVRAFLERSGMNLYFMLLKNGFPAERIVFLTANANATTSNINDLRQAFDSDDDDSFQKILGSITSGFGDKEKNDAYQFIDHPDGCDEGDITALCDYLETYFNKLNEGQQNNTYEILRETANNCRVEVPKALNKGGNQLDIELNKYENNRYLILRRGVIDGCEYAESLVSEFFYFNAYTLENEKTQEEDIRNYFVILKNFLPMKEPDNKKALYKLFIRTLTHEWEAAKRISLDKNKRDAVLAWIMRNTRHWITHNSNLFNEANEFIVAYLFLINIRVMFDSNDLTRDYEKILFTIFENESIDEDDFSRKKIPIREAYMELKTLVNNSNQNNSDQSCQIKDDYYFHKLANNVQESKSKIRNDHNLFIKILFQMFWLLTSNPLSKTRDSNNLFDIEFYNFNYKSEPYLHEVARHIYHRSFPEA